MTPHIHELIGKAIQLLQNSSPEDAQKILEQVLNLDQNNLPALEILGVIKASRGEHAEAVLYLEKAIKLDPNNPSLQYNLAKALSECNRNIEALPHHEQALRMVPTNPDAWLNYGKSLAILKNYQIALDAFNRALLIQPNYFEALLSQGAAHKELHNYKEALTCAEKAISLRPDFAAAWLNKGASHKALNQLAVAMESYDQALSLQPEYAEAWSNKASILKDLKRYPEAIAHYSRALEINPEMDFLNGEILHLQMRIGDWSNFDERIQSLIKAIYGGKKAIMPFPALALFNSEELNYKIVTAATGEDLALHRRSEILPATVSRSKKIKIAYYSADFKNHPISHLTSKLFNVHHRDQFEVYAFSLLNAGEKDAMRNEMLTSFDHFIDVDNLSDQEIVDLSRKLEIDIAIDLGGHTTDARNGIFELRAAPNQINYLGYPGTMGSPAYDYIIADRIVIPEANQAFFTEKIIYLPNSYQANNDEKEISTRLFTKEELGLPNNKFVFCCFNNNFKITPTIFTLWMNILKRVENSVLWLFEDNEFISNNLKREAENNGVSFDRIIFAKRLSQQDHLARHRQADLFLDTLPYNAHTTASDALWCGIPVITLMGNSFPARVAGSLLNAVGLPELITQSPEEYEELAVKLANNPDLLKKIKNKLETNRLQMPLFNTELFCKHLESAYKKVYERYLSNLNPEHLSIEKD